MNPLIWLVWTIVPFLGGLFSPSSRETLYYPRQLVAAHIFSMPDPVAAPPEILLKAHWSQKFEGGTGRPLLSFLNREALSVISTPRSTSAVDMLTGKTLWQSDGAAGLFLQNLSRKPEFPLLGLRNEHSGEITLMRLDPANGRILWQQTLPERHPRINFDARHIAVLSDSQAGLYDLSGKLLWQHRFQDGFSPEYIAFHQNLLLGDYTQERVHVKYLDRESGKLLWEKRGSELLPGYAIPGLGRQVFFTENGRSMLLDVTHGEKLWDSLRDLGHVIGHSTARQSGQISLLSTRGMARQHDGELYFSYPAGFRLVTASDDYLFLLQSSSGRQKTCLLLDKSSGETVQQIYERVWFALFYLSEDQEAIYLAANSKSQERRENNITTSVVRLDKHNWEVKEIPVGRNLGAIRFNVFPQEGLVFIPSYQQIGGYLLPEM